MVFEHEERAFLGISFYNSNVPFIFSFYCNLATKKRQILFQYVRKICVSKKVTIYANRKVCIFEKVRKGVK